MKKLMNVVFPHTIDNDYKGLKIALYAFYILTLVTLWRSQHHLFAADGGAMSIASIPLDTFTSDGEMAVIGVFGLWGLSQLIIGFIYLAVAIRYRSLVPFMYLLMFFEYIMRTFYISNFKPIPTLETAPGAIGNIIFIIIVPILFTLSIIGRRQPEKEESA